jgi:hypothetical protein
MIEYFLFKRVKIGVLYLLPAGLYLEDNRKFKINESLLRKLKKYYNIGDRLVLKNEKITNIFKPVNEIFVRLDEKRYKPIDIESNDPRRLTLDEMIKEIKDYKYEKTSTPYENYLKACVISYFLQSLNYSKSLIGGIWSSDGMKVEYQKKDLFRYFIYNIDSKNVLIQKIKPFLYQFPEDMFTRTEDLKLPSFSEFKTSEEIKLEYRVLQIKFKIILQEIMLHSYYMTTEEKQYYDQLYKEVINHLRTYPQGKDITY